YDPERVSAAVRERAEKQSELLAMLSTGFPKKRTAVAIQNDDASQALVQRTLSRVQQAIDEHQRAMTIPAVERGRGFGGFRFSDLVSVAALLLVAVALIAPLVMGMQEYSR